MGVVFYSVIALLLTLMLPQVFPPPARNCPVDVWGLVHPAREVGGDLYDFFTTADGSLCFCWRRLGKGMPAALFMARTKSLMRVATELMRERGGSRRFTSRHHRTGQSRAVPEQQRYDVRDAVLRHAGAGHRGGPLLQCRPQSALSR